MKTLVTGAAGLIGSNLVRALLDAGHSVRALHLPGEDLRNLRGLDIELLAGDVTDRPCMDRAVAGRDWVFHLAAIYALWLPRPERMREVNVGGTRNVLEACLAAGVARVVHTSSIAVFGGQGLGTHATEQSPFRLGATGDLYSITKYESHHVALEMVDRGLDVVIAAPCGPIGPGDVGPTPTGRILLSSVNLPIPVVVATEANLIDVRDCAAGHILAAERGRTGETYLLGAHNVKPKQLVQLAMAELGIWRPVIELPIGLLHGPARGLELLSRRVTGRPPLFTPAALRIAKLGLTARCDKAVRELGLAQRPILDSVRDALAWFAANGYVRGSTAHALRFAAPQAGSR